MPSVLFCFLIFFIFFVNFREKQYKGAIPILPALNKTKTTPKNNTQNKIGKYRASENTLPHPKGEKQQFLFLHFLELDYKIYGFCLGKSAQFWWNHNLVNNIFYSLDLRTSSNRFKLKRLTSLQFLQCIEWSCLGRQWKIETLFARAIIAN